MKAEARTVFALASVSGGVAEVACEWKMITKCFSSIFQAEYAQMNKDNILYT